MINNQITIAQLYNELFLDVNCGNTDDQLEYINLTYELLNNPDVLELMNIRHHHYTNRLLHSLHVSYYTYYTCKKRNWDYISATKGALLHDFFILDKDNSTLKTRKLSGFYHPKIAMNRAMSQFTLNEVEKNCILRHMFPLTPIPAKYKESWVVIFWDKIWGIRELLRLQPSNILIESKVSI